MVEDGVVERSLLIVGEQEPLQDALVEILENRYALDVEVTPAETAAEAAIAAAPDLILLVGEALGDSGAAVLERLASSPLASVTPAALLTDNADLDERFHALRFGAVAVVRRSASADDIARRIVELMRELPERSGRAFGELGEATLEEFIDLLSRELRSGILSVKGTGAQQGESVRLALGEGQDVDALVRELIDRVGSLVQQSGRIEYEFHEQPSGTVQVVLGEEGSSEGEMSDVRGVRVLLADSDPVRADTVAQELRARGAIVMIADLHGRRLEQLRNTDPSVLIIGDRELRGEGFHLIKRMREDTRLRWAFLMVVSWDEIWSETAHHPATDALVAKLAKLVDPERTLQRKVSEGKRFDVRLEVLGPARLLRTIASTSQPLRMTVRQPEHGVVRIDVTEQLVAGADAHLKGNTTLEGPAALAAFLVMGQARIRVEPVQHPASANLMTPVDAALDLASAEPTPLEVGRPAASETGRVSHVAFARTGQTDPPPSGATEEEASPGTGQAPQPNARAKPPPPPPPPPPAKRGRHKTLVGVGAPAPDSAPTPESSGTGMESGAEAGPVPDTEAVVGTQAAGKPGSAPEPEWVAETEGTTTPTPDPSSMASPQSAHRGAKFRKDVLDVTRRGATALRRHATELSRRVAQSPWLRARLQRTLQAADARWKTIAPRVQAWNVPRPVWITAAALPVVAVVVGLTLAVADGGSGGHTALAKGTSAGAGASGEKNGTTAARHGETEAREVPSPSDTDRDVKKETAHDAKEQEPQDDPSSAVAENDAGTSGVDAGGNPVPSRERGAAPPQPPPGIDADPPIPDHVRDMSEVAKRRKTYRLRDLAGRLHGNGRYEKAEKWWRRAWTYRPGDPMTAAGLARTLVKAGNVERGLAWARYAIELEPDTGRFRAVLGELLFDRGQLEAAIEAYERAVELEPDSDRLARRLRNLQRARESE